MAQVRGMSEIEPARLRRARLMAGVGSRELAGAVGRAPAFIAKLEKGRTKSIDQDDVGKISDYLAGKDRLADRTSSEVRLFLEGRGDFKTVEFVSFRSAPRRTGVFQRPMIFRWRSLAAAGIRLGT